MIVSIRESVSFYTVMKTFIQSDILGFARPHKLGIDEDRHTHIIDKHVHSSAVPPLADGYYI